MSKFSVVSSNRSITSTEFPPPKKKGSGGFAMGMDRIRKELLW